MHNALNDIIVTFLITFSEVMFESSQINKKQIIPTMVFRMAELSFLVQAPKTINNSLLESTEINKSTL